jgi:hypothetical protein
MSVTDPQRGTSISRTDTRTPLQHPQLLSEAQAMPMPQLSPNLRRLSAGTLSPKQPGSARIASPERAPVSRLDKIFGGHRMWPSARATNADGNTEILTGRTTERMVIDGSAQPALGLGKNDDELLIPISGHNVRRVGPSRSTAGRQPAIPDRRFDAHGCRSRV